MSNHALFISRPPLPRRSGPGGGVPTGDGARYRSFALWIARCVIGALIVGMLLIACTVSCHAAPCDYWERETMRRIASEYRLSGEQTRLLFAVRRVESGGPGIEFGVMQHFPRHPARLYSAFPERSFEVQCRWAAGTISRRYKRPADLQAFAARYCPENKRYAELIMRAKR